VALSDFHEGFDGWVPAETPVEQKPQVPDPTTQVSGYLRTTLPLPLQYSPDTLKQYNRPGMSSFRIAPLPPGGVPAINSASSTVAQSSIQTFITSAGAAGTNGDVQFNAGGALSANNSFFWNSVASVLNAPTYNATIGYQVSGTAASGSYLRGNGTNFVSSGILVGDLPTGYPWSSLGNATGSLTLANSTFNTTFQQTIPSAQWTWVNTTAATGGTNQASPVLAIQGQYWAGAASATDTWTIQDVLGGGSNPSSSLSINHSGSSGTAAVSIGPGLSVTGAVLFASTVNGLTIPTAAGSAVFAQLIASGTATLGTTLIGATSSATAVTVAATGVATTDSIEWAFNAAPGSGYTSGLFVQVYVTSGNVNFVVTNPTAGGLTPAAATLNWRVLR
jgi:hypothetical protein